MRALVVLDDCRSALEAVDAARSEQEFRVRWVALVALLRAVGHVLDKVDGASTPSFRSAVDARWKEWQRDRSKHSPFWDFIEAERNSVLKTYESGVAAGDVQVAVTTDVAPAAFTLDERLFKPLEDGPFAGEDGRDAARGAISWWENELSKVSSAASAMR